MVQEVQHLVLPEIQAFIPDLLWTPAEQRFSLTVLPLTLLEVLSPVTWSRVLDEGKFHSPVPHLIFQPRRQEGQQFPCGILGLKDCRFLALCSNFCPVEHNQSTNAQPEKFDQVIPHLQPLECSLQPSGNVHALMF